MIRIGARRELARRDFFSYCRLKAPDFYRSERLFLVELCEEFQSFLFSDELVMIVNIPPRHGKSRTAGCFVEWVLGRDKHAKIMTGSYNETLSTMFSKNVRDTISEAKADVSKTVYSDVFPNVRIKKGDGAMNLWSLEGGYNNYLATSPTGTATGFGCSLMIIDDLIKNAEEANNENIKQKHWDWFTNTMLSRLEDNGKIIIIMTRWASDDLAGRALEHYRQQGTNIRHITMKALVDKDKQLMLCPDILSYRSYQEKVRAMGHDVASANYQQEPIDVKGRLYERFMTYTKEPSEFEGIYSYTDTADEGTDYLCSIIFGVYRREAYVLDVYYTQASMETTEQETAQRHKQYGVNQARIESNNGGSGFARNVRRISMEAGNVTTVFTWFHQSKNKRARIISNSAWVQRHVYFPENWRDSFPEFYNDMTKYQREGKNAHDDAPDALTGVAEIMYKLGG